MLELLRQELHRLHLELPRNQLVVCTSGNVSLRDPASGLVLIKPSGVFYDELAPASYVALNLDGQVVEGALKPSSDTASHLYIYRRRPDLHAIVHTHSPYATAFAVAGESIPVCLTALADEFGAPVPCTNLAFVGGEEIGREVVGHLGDSRVVLLRQHGVVAVGGTGREAVRAAVVVEEAAKTIWLARQLGPVSPIPPADVQRMRRRFQAHYGQPSGNP